MLTTLVAVAGGLGALLRFLIDAAISSRLRGNWPVATLLINITGSCALGAMAELASRGAVRADSLAIVGTGLCGGYTTFSTATLETLALAIRRRPVTALVQSAGSLVLCVAAALLGMWLAGQ